MCARNQVTIVPETITISVTGEACSLSLPRVHRSKSNIAPPERVYETHLEYRLRAEPRAGLSRDKLKKKAELEIASIYTTFPDVIESNIVLAMAAWFCLLYTVDDLIEEIQDPYTAVNVLKQSPLWFATPQEQPSPHQPVESSIGPLPSRFDEDYQEQLPGAIAYTCREFAAHARLLVPEFTYQRLLIAINDVWQGMVSEIQFRQQRRSSVAPYMQIRVRTIGLAPFFVLLRRSTGKADPWLLPMACEHTARLEKCVKTAVGIQNDLVGLAKDLQEGEHMNWVLLELARLNLSASESEGEAESVATVDSDADSVVSSIIQAGAQRAVAVHNREVLAAYGHLHEMRDQEYGLMLIGFIERHLRWAQMTARYKLAAAKKTAI